MWRPCSATTRDTRLALGVLVALLASLPAGAQVRELKTDGQGVTLGTDAFSLTVEKTGTLRAVKVGATVLFPFVALYTNPTSTEEDGKPVRCCQAEQPGLGDRPSQVTTSFAGGTATIIILRDCSHPKLYGNAPIWNLRETVTVQPDGLIRVNYQCRFLRFLPGMSWTAVFAGAMPEFTGRAWQGQIPTMTIQGTIPDSLPKRDETTGLWGLSLASSRGPVQFTFGQTSRVEVNNWGQYLEVGAMLPNLPHGGQPMYRGVQQEITVSLKLPVSH